MNIRLFAAVVMTMVMARAASASPIQRTMPSWDAPRGLELGMAVGAGLAGNGSSTFNLGVSFRLHRTEAPENLNSYLMGDLWGGGVRLQVLESRGLRTTLIGITLHGEAALRSRLRRDKAPLSGNRDLRVTSLADLVLPEVGWMKRAGGDESLYLAWNLSASLLTTNHLGIGLQWDTYVPMRRSVWAVTSVVSISFDLRVPVRRRSHANGAREEERPADVEPADVEPAPPPAPPPLPTAKIEEQTHAPVTVTMPARGTLIWFAESGSTVAKGDPVARLKAWARQEKRHKQRSARLVYYRRKLDQARAELDQTKKERTKKKLQKNIARYEAKVAEKTRLVEAAREAMQNAEIKAPANGTVEVLARLKSRIHKDAPILTISAPPTMKATFTLTGNERYEVGSDVAIRSENGDKTATCRVVTAEDASVTVSCPAGGVFVAGDTVVLE